MLKNRFESTHSRKHPYNIKYRVKWDIYERVRCQRRRQCPLGLQFRGDASECNMVSHCSLLRNRQIEKLHTADSSHTTATMRQQLWRSIMHPPVLPRHFHRCPWRSEGTRTESSLYPRPPPLLLAKAAWTSLHSSEQRVLKQNEFVRQKAERLTLLACLEL